LEIEFAPVVEVARPRVEQALQYDMDLHCHVVAYPPPAITWLHNDIVLSNSQHQRYKLRIVYGVLYTIVYLKFYFVSCSISHFATSDEYTDTTLRVITIEKRQYGTYTCKAANKLGISEAQVQLIGMSLAYG
jgi:neuronal growth regulator 1